MCNLQNNDLLCSKCRCQRDKLFKYIDMKNSVTMATLGPEGTTSSEAAKVFKKYIETRIISSFYICHSFAKSHKRKLQIRTTNPKA